LILQNARVTVAAKRTSAIATLPNLTPIDRHTSRTRTKRPMVSATNLSKLKRERRCEIMKVKLCKVRDCNDLHWAKGFCNTHYQRNKRTGTCKLAPRPTICKNKDCYEAVHCKKMCRNCYARSKYKTVEERKNPTTKKEQP